MYGFLSTILCITCAMDIFYKTEQHFIYYLPALITYMALILTYITNPCVIDLKVDIKENTEEQKLIVSKFTSGKENGYILKPPHAAFSSWTKRMIFFYDHHVSIFLFIFRAFLGLYILLYTPDQCFG